MKKLLALLFLPLLVQGAEYEFLTPRTVVIRNFKGSLMSSQCSIAAGRWRKENGLLRDRRGKILRKADMEDYLFCNTYGDFLSEDALRNSIEFYNKRRGVKKTSIHLFRHTFARKYLVDCGGNAFTLQKLLGHSTLDMTKHYCTIFDADIAKNFDSFSPLEKMNANSRRIRMNSK